MSRFEVGGWKLEDGGEVGRGGRSRRSRRRRRLEVGGRSRRRRRKSCKTVRGFTKVLKVQIEEEAQITFEGSDNIV